MAQPILEPVVKDFAEAASKPPFIYQLTPEQARKVLDDLQAKPIDKIDLAEDKWITVPVEVGDVRVRIIKPRGTTGPLPVILYVHGGGWVLGNSGTHDRLIRELADGARAALAFVEYNRSPEARYPVAIEQAYATARWIIKSGASEGLDSSRMAIAGDSVGGNMTAAVTILAKQRGDVQFAHQSLYYPVTDARQNTESYRQFADGPWLSANAMAWFWDAYIGNAPEKRDEITVSPLRASTEDLKGLPPAFVLVDQNDVLRDEGEAYAAKLTQAGVPTISVRYNFIFHDFMMLNPCRAAQATTGAITQATQVLRKALGTN